MSRLIRIVLMTASVIVPATAVVLNFAPVEPLHPTAPHAQLQGYREGRMWAYYEDMRIRAARRAGLDPDNLPCWGGCQ